MRNRIKLPRPAVAWGKLVSPWTLATACAVLAAVALGIGWSEAAAQSSAASEHSSAVEQELKKLKGELRDITAERDNYQSQAETASNERDDIESRQSELDEAAAQLAEQQKQFEAEQKRVEASQLTDGVHVVGTDTAPGVYSVNDATDCYYVWKTGTGSDADIVDNNIVSGPATVTLKAGEVFETNGCGTWTKVG